MSRVLIVFDKFAPFNASGTARVHHFVKNLPSFGYTPEVLACALSAGYPRDDALLDDLPDSLDVRRAPLLLTPTKDRIAGAVNRRRPKRKARVGAPAPPPRNPRRIFQPGSALWKLTGLPMWVMEWHLDWAPAALVAALADASLRSVDLVWVSAPPVRNLFVAYVLSRLLDKPLVIDLRDPWTYGSLWVPRGKVAEELERAWARRILGHARRVVFTSPLTQAEMARRHPYAAEKFRTITNGFSEIEVEPLRGGHEGKCLFRYVGLLNVRRTPEPLLEGLAIASQDPIVKRDVHVEFVGDVSVHENTIRSSGLGVSIRPRVPYVESQRLVRGSDVNVVLQTLSEGDDVIAGKTFDYLAAKKPILAVVSPTGGDAWLLGETGGAEICPYTDPESVAAAIRRCWVRWRSGAEQPMQHLERFERKTLSRDLAALLDEVLDEPA